MWACGVAAAARAAATAPGLRLFVLGALGGVAGVWEARESGVWCRRFSGSPLSRESACTRRGAAGRRRRGGAAGAGAGAAGWGELGAGAEAVGSRIQAAFFCETCLLRMNQRHPQRAGTHHKAALFSIFLRSRVVCSTLLAENPSRRDYALRCLCSLSGRAVYYRRHSWICTHSAAAHFVARYVRR